MLVGSEDRAYVESLGICAVCGRSRRYSAGQRYDPGMSTRLSGPPRLRTELRAARGALMWAWVPGQAGAVGDIAGRCRPGARRVSAPWPPDTLTEGASEPAAAKGQPVRSRPGRSRSRRGISTSACPSAETPATGCQRPTAGAWPRPVPKRTHRPFVRHQVLPETRRQRHRPG